MSDAQKTRLALPLGLATLLAFVALFGWLLLRAQAMPVGPQPIVWDKEACAHCRMHVGEPTMAAQAQLADGRVLNFDDPGCLMSWLEASSQQPTAVYLRHHREDRWLTRAQAGFLPVPASPMGFNLGAALATEPGALSWEQAAERVRGRPLMGDR